MRPICARCHLNGILAYSCADGFGKSSSVKLAHSTRIRHETNPRHRRCRLYWLYTLPQVARARRHCRGHRQRQWWRRMEFGEAQEAKKANKVLAATRTSPKEARKEKETTSCQQKEKGKGRNQALCPIRRSVGTKIVDCNNMVRILSRRLFR